MENVLITSKEYLKNNESYIKDVISQYPYHILYNSKAGAMKEDDLISVINEHNCVGLLVYSSSDEVTDRVITSCPTLKAISRHGVGLENIDVEAAKRHGIAVYNTSNSHDYEAVADWVFSSMLAFGRGLCKFNEQMSEGEWNRIPKFNVWGKTIGIVGFGRIGSVVAKRAAAFNMRVLVAESASAVSRTYPDYVEVLPFEELLKVSDFISLHSIVTPETKGMMGKEQFQLMKPTAYLINSGRAALVKQEELLEALSSNTIAGAAIDVYDIEPAVNDPLVKSGLSNIILTPHIGIYTLETLREIDVLAMENLLKNLKTLKLTV